MELVVHRYWSEKRKTFILPFPHLSGHLCALIHYLSSENIVTGQVVWRLIMKKDNQVLMTMAI